MHDITLLVLHDITLIVLKLIEYAPSILTAIASVVGARAAIGALKQGKNNGADIKLADDKTEVLIKKADVIHDLTNSNLTKVKADLAAAVEHIAQLQALVEKFAGGSVAGVATSVTPVRDEQQP